MKKIPFLILTTAAVLSFNSYHAQKKAEGTGINLHLMDTSVRPQDDFFNYVNGNWVKTAVIPSDKGSWGSFNELREKTDENSLAILKNILSEKFAKGTEGQKFRICMLLTSIGTKEMQTE
jgi:putative endopeptidase